ncbi:MAG TPA: RluA family pseudouridine synthase [Thermoanaerobaculia bacterium]|nr:RluA family pseudouridine synthase [Thermoanaerobaculia bacterium]
MTPVSPLAILYEDDALLFLDKPPHVVVQRGHDPAEPVLFEVAAAHTSPLFLLQRLDRGTSGVIFFSKRSELNPKITRQFELRRIRKRYFALAEGELAEHQIIDAPLSRVGPISFGVREGGKRAVTEVQPLSVTTGGSLIEVLLHTGRTHQIRAHLAAIGHPLAGDWLYGERNEARPMLHAAQVDMTHPVSNTPLSVRAPLPEDFLAACRARGIVPRRGQTDPSGVQLND